MVSWGEFEGEAPQLAARVRARFEAHKHLLLATVRRDGAPRISGTEATIALGELWLGMMPASMKGRDLVRDPRFALHSAPLDLQLADGDAKVSGHAIEVVDPTALAAFWARWAAAQQPPREVGDAPAVVMFRAELDAAVVTTVAGDELVIDSWRAGEAPRQVRRK